MKKLIENIVRFMGYVVVAAIAGYSAGMVGGVRVVERDLLREGTERAEAQASFTDKDEVTVEFPALVRGRRVLCVVVANTKRKTQSIFC